MLRIPLIVRMPGVQPRRVPSVVRLVDVLPTALDLLGMPLPPTHGTSLTALMNGKPQDALEAYAESLYPRRFGWSPVRSLRENRFKLIAAPRPELYDLDNDPMELHNLHDERPALAAALARRLAAYADVDASSPRSANTVQPEVRERLAALGYVSVGSWDGYRSQPGLRDAKDFIGQNWVPPAADVSKGTGAGQ